MSREKIKLVEPTVEMNEKFLAMAQECLRAEANPEVWDFEGAFEDFDAYVKKRQDYAEGRSLPEGWVAASDYWLVKDKSTILGCSSLRHRLTKALRRFGGNIGYFIRPSERGKGYGAKMLGLTLEKAKELGLKRVLITCDDDNAASVRIIEKNGGVLEDKIMNEGHEVLTRRYWIDLQ